MSELKPEQALAITIVPEVLKSLLGLIDLLCKVWDLGEDLFGPS